MLWQVIAIALETFAAQAASGDLESQAGTSGRSAAEDYRQRYTVERSFAWLGTSAGC